MPILSRSDKKMPNMNYNEDLEKLTTLTVTQADTKCDKLKVIYQIAIENYQSLKEDINFIIGLC